jgi:hypothetical protein
MPFSGAGLVLAPGEAVTIDIKEIGYVRCFGHISGFDYISYLGVT